MRAPPVPAATSLVNSLGSSGNSILGDPSFSETDPLSSHNGPLNSSSSWMDPIPCPKSARSWLHYARTHKISTVLAAIAIVFLLATVEVDDGSGGSAGGGTISSSRGASIVTRSDGRQAENGGGGLLKALGQGMGKLSDEYRMYLALPPVKQTSALGALRGNGLAMPEQPSVSIPPGQTVVSYFFPHLAPITEPLAATDTPIFFHIPRAGTSIKSILSGCLGLIMATDAGTRNGHDRDRTARVVSMPKGGRYVNVDTTTLPGLQRAAGMGLAQSQLADVIVTPHIYTAVTTLFDQGHRARMFTTIRHPIERAVSMYYYLSVADWEPTYDPDLTFVNVEMYARSDRVENNWMLRFLTGEMTGDLTERHLDVAKELLRTYCLVGLMEEKAESIRRFESYLGFAYRGPEGRDCRDKYLHWDYGNKHEHPTVEEGSTAWKLLYRNNELDMKLYEYALEVFQEQGKLFQPGGMYYNAVEEEPSNVAVDAPTGEPDEAPGIANAASTGDVGQIPEPASQELGERRLSLNKELKLRLPVPR